MKAIIMAGGEGTRLRPLTCDCPKPMMRLMDKPVMEYALRGLAERGITEIAATLGYLPDAVTEYFGDGSQFGAHMRYYIEREPLGTAGGVAQARDFLDETFIVLSGDGITDMDCMEAVQFHREHNAEVTLVLKRVENPLEYGVVVTDADGRIRAFQEKPGWGDVVSDAVNTGIYVIEPRILEKIPKNVPMDFGKELFPKLLQDGCRMYGYVTEAYWCDIGDISAYLQAHMDALRGKLRLNIPTAYQAPTAQVDSSAELIAPYYIGEGARVYAHAKIESAVLGEGASARAGASVKHAVLWRGAQVMRQAQARGCVLGTNALLGESAQAYEGCALGTGAVVGARAVLRPNVKLWPDKFAQDGSCIEENLVWGSQKSLGYTAGILPLDAPLRVAQACAAALRPKELLLGRMPSAIAGALWHAVAAGMMAQGVQVVDAGLCHMPQLRFLQGILHTEAAALVGEDRLYLLNADGASLSADIRRKISALIQRQDYAAPFSGITPPIVSAGRTELSYIAYLASAYAESTENAPEIALYCGNNYALSVSEQAFRRAGLMVRGEWEEEMMSLSPDEVGIWLSDSGEFANFSDADGKLSDAEQQMLIAWTACMLGEKILYMPPDATRAMDIVALGFHAQVQTVAGERSAWMDALSKHAPTQFRLHFDGTYCALRALDCLAKMNWTLAQWRKEMPKVYRSTMDIEIPLSKRGNVLGRLAEEMPNSKLGGGVRFDRGDGWAWVGMDEESGLCRVVAEGRDAEFARELCDFTRNAVCRA